MYCANLQVCFSSSMSDQGVPQGSMLGPFIFNSFTVITFTHQYPYFEGRFVKFGHNFFNGRIIEKLVGVLKNNANLTDFASYYLIPHYMMLTSE